MNLNQVVSSCYIHIPFCNRICSYCDFCKLFYNEELVDKYLESLEKEIKDIYKGEVLNTIYIGGGTPSSLSFNQLEKLLEIIKCFNISSSCEFSIECNFDSINKDKLLLLKKYGVNRLSFGLESIDKNNLHRLGRSEDIEKTKSVIDLCHSLGFNNINIDLMYAIEGEDIKTLDKDIDFILSLGITHISTYSLIIEEHTKLYIDKAQYISEDLDYEMYKHICEKLKKYGYKHYEISNFAKDGYYSKHNLCYWHNEEYYGFGLGASSYLKDIRSTNTRSITKYLQGKMISNYEKLSKSDKMSYEMILGLRLLEGVSKKKFEDKYGISLDNVYNIDNLIENGDIISSSDYIKIPEDKLYVSNEILINFIEE